MSIELSGLGFELGKKAQPKIHPVFKEDKKKESGGDGASKGRAKKPRGDKPVTKERKHSSDCAVSGNSDNRASKAVTKKDYYPMEVPWCEFRPLR